MEFRNAKFTGDGRIDIEVNHPVYGWIPYTADASDSDETCRDLHAKAMESGNVAPHEPPSAEDARSAMPSLTARQLRLGLIANGIMPSQVQSVLEAMPEGPSRESALVEWEYASSFERTHPLIASVSAGLSLTDEQVDAMWMKAVSL